MSPEMSSLSTFSLGSKRMPADAKYYSNLISSTLKMEPFLSSKLSVFDLIFPSLIYLENIPILVLLVAGSK